MKLKNFADSDFVVTFTGENPSSKVIRTWDRVLDYLDAEATNGTQAESYRNEDSGIDDPDNWILLDWGSSDDGNRRFQFSAGIGEMDHVTITRITEPFDDERLREKEQSAP